MKPKSASTITLGTTDKGRAFTVPIDLATESLAIIARKGAGKTYTGRVISEDMLAAHVQTVVLDPLDVWWGLRLSTDGKRAGENVVIFGGSHADLPLTEHLGKTLADLVVDRGVNAVLVLDHLSISAQRRFVATFCEHLFDRKSAQEHRTPLHLIIDEADSFAPQQPPPDAMPCLGAVDRIVRRARSRGIGSTVISQRPAVLSKNVLTQTEVLIALQVTSPQDRGALTEWIKANADTSQAAEFLGSLSGLKRGEAWIWSPSRLEVLQRIDIRPARTYDSSYTPKVGEKRREPPRLRPIDLEQLRGQLDAVIAEAAANDPKALKAKIRDLEAKLASKPAGASKEALAQAYAKGVADTREGYAAKCMRMADQLRAAGRTVVDVASDIMPDTTASRRAKAVVPVIEKPAWVTDGAKRERMRQREPAVHLSAPRPESAGDVKLSKAERLILTVLAQRGPRTRRQIAVQIGYAHKGGAYQNAVARLNSCAFIERRGEDTSITDSGRIQLGDVPPMPTGDALLAHWYAQLSKAERLILEKLVGAFPNGLHKTALGEETGYEATGGSFQNALARLNTLGLIERQQSGHISAHPELMDSVSA